MKIKVYFQKVKVKIYNVQKLNHSWNGNKGGDERESKPKVKVSYESKRKWKCYLSQLFKHLCALLAAKGAHKQPDSACIFCFLNKEIPFANNENNDLREILILFAFLVFAIACYETNSFSFENEIPSHE